MSHLNFSMEIVSSITANLTMIMDVLAANVDFTWIEIISAPPWKTDASNIPEVSVLDVLKISD